MLKPSKRLLKTTFFLLGLFLSSYVLASTNMTIGDVARNITANFADLAKLITAGSYISGLGFSIGAIMKFKQHKDNPTQIPVGTPIALMFVASALLFLPSLLGVTGSTVFGDSRKTSGPSGIIFK